jgi:carbonic anhydrase
MHQNRIHSILPVAFALLAAPAHKAWSHESHPPAAAPHGAQGKDAHPPKGGHGADPHAAKPRAIDPQAKAAAEAAAKANLQRLKDGNLRFTSGKSERPHQGADQRELVAKGQKPFALILGCADSRVPPEILFDQGLGDLFVVRVAGNVVDDPGLGSIEYAVEHLNVKLIVVLGHERCGAVDAATKGGDPGGHIGSLVHAIAPAVESARIRKGNLLEEAVKANVLRIVSELKNSAPILAPEAQAGLLTVVGAVYDLDTGTADFLP